MFSCPDRSVDDTELIEVRIQSTRSSTPQHLLFMPGGQPIRAYLLDLHGNPSSLKYPVCVLSLNTNYCKETRLLPIGGCLTIADLEGAKQSIASHYPSSLGSRCNITRR
jgi:hypothetical protein